MSGHDNEGETLCIHSLVTKEAHRRKKIATQQMAQYLVHVSCLLLYHKSRHRHKILSNMLL